MCQVLYSACFQVLSQVLRIEYKVLRQSLTCSSSQNMTFYSSYMLVLLIPIYHTSGSHQCRSYVFNGGCWGYERFFFFPLGTERGQKVDLGCQYVAREVRYPCGARANIPQA